MTRSFDPAGVYAPLDAAQWVVLKAAIDGDATQRDEALITLGALVLDDWLGGDHDGAERNSAELGAMRSARETYQDRSVRQRCQLGVNVLQELSAERETYDAHRLDTVGRVLLRIAMELQVIAEERKEAR
ncbi:hypothetical protein B1813_22345 [Saccharomonospora piscinae]|uniref:Uncharacterized protein n=1 Tax=Saccharomonospora piscinae TaxID=687388 RepID=A0A1V8ZXX9_SACPI|nr:hypothetical protein B1813_22345 [Saccharomonospora piscinae]